MMPRSYLDDRWLLLGLIASLYIATRGIAHGLARVQALADEDESRRVQAVPSSTAREVNVSSDDDDDNDAFTEEPIDKIPQSALSTLYRGPNSEIAKAAVDVLSHRFLNRQESQREWIRDLFSPDASLRKRAATLHRFLRLEYDSCGLAATSAVVLLKPLIAISIRSDGLAGETVRKVYAVVDGSGSGRMRTLLLNLARAMDITDDQSVIVVENIKDGQVKWWLEAMHHRIWKDMMNSSDRGLARALERMHDAALDGVEGVDEDEDEETEEIEDPLTKIMGYRLLERRFGAEYEADVLGEIMSMSSLTEAPRTRYREASFEEDEVRRRRREAMVLEESDGHIEVVA